MQINIETKCGGNTFLTFTFVSLNSIIINGINSDKQSQNNILSHLVLYKYFTKENSKDDGF